MSSRTRANFGFLEQILEEEEAGDDNRDLSVSSGTERSDIAQTKPVNKCQQETKNTERSRNNPGPSGPYPVEFSSLRNKACQTRLSTFPMFPLHDLEDAVWLSDGDGRVKKNKTASKVRTPKKTLKSNKYEERKDIADLKSKILRASNEELCTEHQLKHSKNPVLLAWLHRKNKLSKQKKRAERREKKAKRSALLEEKRLREERIVESEKKVKEWMEMKRRQIARTWSKLRRVSKAIKSDDNNKIAAAENQVEALGKQIPANYRVIRSFQYQFDSEDARSTANKVTPALNQDHSNCVPRNTKSSLNSAKAQSSEIQERVGNAKSVRPKTAVMRPKTAVPTGRKNDLQVAVEDIQNEKEQTPKMQAMTYDEWLKYKRKENRKQKLEQKRETADSHLEKVISELGKERLRKLRESKKQVDSGLKNFKQRPNSTGNISRTKSINKWLIGVSPLHSENSLQNPSASTSGKVPRHGSQEGEKEISQKTSFHRNKVSRPKSAWSEKSRKGNGPTSQEINTIERQMNSMDLLEKQSMTAENKSKIDNKSTVRDNYFDYGSDDNTASSRRNNFVNQSPSQSLDFQIM